MDFFTKKLRTFLQEKKLRTFFTKKNYVLFYTDFFTKTTYFFY